MKTNLKLFLILLLVSAPAFAGERFAITGSAVRSNARTAASLGIDDALRYSSDTGFGLAFDYFWTHALSTQVSASWAKPQLTERSLDATSVFGDTQMMPVTASLLFHLAPASWIEMYAGGGGAWVEFRDLKASPGLAGIDVERVKFKSGSGPMAQAGVTLGSWRGVGFNVDAKYLDVDIESQATFSDQTTSKPLKMDINPWLLSAGVRFRF